MQLVLLLTQTVNWTVEDVFQKHKELPTASFYLTAMNFTVRDPALASHHQTQPTLFVEAIDRTRQQLPGIKP